MKPMLRFATVALLIGTAVVAQAQTNVSDDAARRARNRDEAIAHHNGLPSGASNTTRSRYSPAKGDDSVRAKTHRTADKTRGFTHRQLTKVRDFGARTNAKFPPPRSGVEDGNKAPAAIGK